MLSLLTFEDSPPAYLDAPLDPLAIGLAAAGCAAAFFGASQLLTHRFLGPLTFLPLLLRYVLPQGPLYGQIFAGATIFLLPPLIGLIFIRRHLSTAFGMGAVR